MSERELLRARLLAESIECTEDELNAILAGLPAARETLARLWSVDCGDLPPASRLVEP